MESLTPSAAELLLPLPKNIRITPGVCPLAQESELTVRVDDRRVESAARTWLSGLSTSGRSVGRAGDVSLVVDPRVCPDPDGYEVVITGDGVRLTGGSAAGCFNGLQTLKQLGAERREGVRCCSIVDQPDFATRGLLHDVTRGKVPRLATLKLIADLLAALKINQLQLNIEHAFVFSFDPDICTPDEGLTPDEVRELDRYCRERFIDLVPAVATFGHMGRILSMPRYQHLAEREGSRPWQEMAWPERMRGFTLDCANPESHRLVERIWSDVLDAFSSPVVNICGDEPWDLGTGKSRERVARVGKGEAYVEHICRTHDICASRGRRTQFWSDVVRHYPHLLDRLPQDTTLLHWGYDDRADYEGTAAFTAAGLATCVCPGTSGWKRIINAINHAERNIATFAAAGKRHGAVGLVNTDWGDHGHFNPLACSWHGIALGAACAWNAVHPTGDQFDAAFCRHILGTDDAGLAGLLREASAIAEGRGETWRWLWTPMADLERDSTIPEHDAIERAVVAAAEAEKRCRSAAGATADPHDAAELAIACRFTGLLADKLRFLREGDHRTRIQWAERVRHASSRYQVIWEARNKPAGFADIKAALEACSADVCRGGRS